MKLIINNSNNIVKSAFLKMNKQSMSLFIHTTDKWIEVNSVKSGIGDSGREENEYYFDVPIKEEEDCYSDDFDSVKLISENDQDTDILNRLTFTLHDTNQLWILYLDKFCYT